jgi:hypothetical protein
MRIFYLAKQAAEPFFPKGFKPNALPDTSPSGMPNASWNKNPRGTTFSMKPAEIISPYYANTPGGFDAAVAKAKANYAAAPTGLKPQLDILQRPVTVRPGNSDYYQRSALVQPGSGNPNRNPAVSWTGAARKNELVKEPSYQYAQRVASTPKGSLTAGAWDYMDKNHYKNQAAMWSVFKNGTPTALEHEMGHAYIEGGLGDPARARTPVQPGRVSNAATGKLHGYFDNPAEEDQGLARTKRETAALTGRRVESADSYRQLEGEINPRGASQGEFEDRIKNYSPEGQRYWRYLRKNKDDADYYQGALQRGETRMPLLVQAGQRAPQNTQA